MHPPFPGPPPWEPNWLAVCIGFPVAGMLAVWATGGPVAYGSLLGSVFAIALSRVLLWRFKRWNRRARAFVAWCEAEVAAGRPLPDGIVLQMRTEV